MAGSVKIPKRVGGVKIPKKFRKKAKKALKLGASPAGREFAAATVAAAAAARARGQALKTEPARTEACAQFDMDGGEAIEALRLAALDGLRRFLEGFEEGLREGGERRPPRPEPPSAPAAS